MCYRTSYIVKRFASAQQRKYRKVHAEPAVQGKPFEQFENRYPIGFSEVHGISPVSYVRNIRKNGVTHEYSYISYKAPCTAPPCRATSSTTREAEEVVSGLSKSDGTMSVFRIGTHRPGAPAKSGEYLEYTVQLNTTGRSKPNGERVLNGTRSRPWESVLAVM